MIIKAVKFRKDGFYTQPFAFGDEVIPVDTGIPAGTPEESPDENSLLYTGKVAELTGLDRKTVDKAFEKMKKDGTIVSPVRCKREPAQK